jgi:ABC-type lipoprotein release transport system permease subunit
LFFPPEAAVFNIVLAACLVPAWRAVRVNAMEALRYK